jgi:ketosteroid isomerase-like protein
MSQEYIDLARGAIARVNRGGEDDALLDEFFAPDAVWHSRADEPDTGVYRGREAIREMIRMWQGVFEDVRFEIEEFIDAGDTVVEPGWLCGRGRDSGAEVREPYTWTYKWRNGKVVEVREYHTKQEALESVGLAG